MPALNAKPENAKPGKPKLKEAKLGIKEFVLLSALPVALFLLFVLDHPFSTEVATKTLSLSPLNWAQKNNIKIAARVINGIVLQPQEEFSFNRAVGPRTAGRGYRYAPSYLGNESLSTAGGGICLLSSALYQTALESGLTVKERVPHNRTIRTVKPGLDSTVWYGQADLKFKNSLAAPIQITAEWQPEGVKVSILGKAGLRASRNSHIICAVRERTKDKLLVEVIRQEGTSAKVISRDLYDITPQEPVTKERYLSAYWAPNRQSSSRRAFVDN